MTISAPYAIQAFEQLFKPLFPHTEPVAAFSQSVQLTGSMYGNTIDERNNSPTEVVRLFRTTILPANAILKGSMVSSVVKDDITWTVIIGLARNVNSAVSNCLLKASCTLRNEQITKIDLLVEAAPNNTLDVIAKFLDSEGLQIGEIKACNY